MRYNIPRMTLSFSFFGEIKSYECKSFPIADHQHSFHSSLTICTLPPFPKCFPSISSSSVYPSDISLSIDLYSIFIKSLARCCLCLIVQFALHSLFVSSLVFCEYCISTLKVMKNEVAYCTLFCTVYCLSFKAILPCVLSCCSSTANHC